MAYADPNYDPSDPSQAGSQGQALARVQGRTPYRRGAGATGSWSDPTQTPANAPDVYDPDAGGMVPSTTDVAGPWDMFGSAIKSGLTRAVQGAAQNTNTGYQAPDDDTGSGAPAPLQRNALAITGPQQFGPLAPTPASPPPDVAGAPGVTRVGNSYSGSQAMAATPSDGMTDAQRNNAPFSAQLATMDAQDRANAATQAQQDQAAQRDSRLQSNQYQAQVAAQKAARDADIANFNLSTGGIGTRRQALARIAAGAQAANENAQGRLTAADAAEAQGPQVNYLGDLQKGQAYTLGAQTMAQNALTDPLHVAQMQQGLQAGGTQQQIAQLQLRQHQREQTMLDQLQTAKTPEERDQMLSQIMALRGQNKVVLTDVLGPTNPITGVPLVMKQAVNAFTGQMIGNPQAMAQSSKPSQVDATQQAKAALAVDPSKKAEINQRLQSWGYPTL